MHHLTEFLANPNHQTWGILTDYIESLPCVAKSNSYYALYSTLKFRYLGQSYHFFPYGIEGDYVSLSATSIRVVLRQDLLSLPVNQCQIIQPDRPTLDRLAEIIYPL